MVFFVEGIDIEWQSLGLCDLSKVWHFTVPWEYVQTIYHAKKQQKGGVCRFTAAGIRV